MQKLYCELNPKTKALWSFDKKDTSTREVVDIPNDQARGNTSGSSVSVILSHENGGKISEIS